MNRKKGISPIIAIIILLLITIAIAGAGYSYISTYWTGLVGREIQVVGSFCVAGNQSRIIVINIGTNTLDTGDIAVINPITGEDISGNVSWSNSSIQPGETTTMSHNCSGMCRYNFIIGTIAKETILDCAGAPGTAPGTGSVTSGYGAGPYGSNAYG